jgi:hypothetical protein
MSKTVEPEMIQLEKLKTKSSKPKKENVLVNMKEIYSSTLEKLKEKVSVINVRSSTLHLIIKYVIELVEETPIKGTEQKEMALKLIRELIKDLTDGADEATLTKLLDDGTISNMIDLIVDASKGRVNINTVVDVSTGCINGCLPYLFSSSRNKKK